MLVLKLKLMMVEKMYLKLEVKLVSGMESVLVNMSKVGFMLELMTVWVYWLTEVLYTTLFRSPEPPSSGLEGGSGDRKSVV